MAVTITSTNVNSDALVIPAHRHIFKMSDSKLVALWVDTTGLLMRSTSTDAGATWGAPAGVFAAVGAAIAYGMGAVQVGDTIYGAATGFSGGIVLKFKLAYAAGAFTDTNAQADLDGSSNNNTRLMGVAWDPNNSYVLVLLANETLGGTAGLYRFDTALANVATRLTDTAFDATGSVVYGDLIADSSNPVKWYWLITDNSPVIKLIPSNGAFTKGTIETVVTPGGTVKNTAMYLNANGDLDIFYTDGGALKTIKRTGVATFSGVTTLVASAVSDSAPASAVERRHLSVIATGNGDDIFVVYTSTTTQANGEIYSIKRASGAWGAATLLAGGSAGGWSGASGIKAIPSDGVAHLLYMTGSPAANIVYNGGLLSGNAPSAPTGVAPSGNITTVVPTCTATYNQTYAGDNLGKYRVLVVRQSDSTVFWDTGAGGTAWGGVAVAPGGTFSIAYAGTALVKGTTYQIQFQFWDAFSSLVGPLSTAVNFTPTDGPACTVTAPSGATTTSGPLAMWTYTQPLNHAQVKYQLLIRDAADTVTIYDSGLIVSAANFHQIPVGTLANLTNYIVRVTVTSTDLLTGTGATTFNTAFIPPGAMA